MTTDIDQRGRVGSKHRWLIAGALLAVSSVVYVVCVATPTTHRSRVLNADGPDWYTPHGEHRFVDVEFSEPSDDGIVRISFSIGARYSVLDLSFEAEEPVGIEFTSRLLELADGKGSVDVPFRVAGPGVGSLSVTVHLPGQDDFYPTQNSALWLGRSADGTLLYSRMSEVILGISRVCLDHPKDVRAQVVDLERMGIRSDSPGTACREMLRYWKRA